MRYLHRTVPLLLLALFVLAGSSCSIGGGSKISQEDADYLNQVNRVMTMLEKRLTADLKKCSKAADPAACMKKPIASFTDQMLNTADAFDRVADNTSGDCERAIRVFSGDIRSLAGEMKKGSITMSEQKLTTDEDAMFSACKLKEL
jgi:hypothetical protein